MRGLKDKVVLITGAAQGIGRAIAQRFWEEDAVVVALDINSEGLDTLSSDFASNEPLKTTVLDITDYAAVSAAIDHIHGQLGRIDVLVNNAGWDTPVQFVESEPEFWHKVIDINLYGSLNMQHRVVPKMLDDGGGRIINIASDAGRVGSSGESVYSACKGGIIAFTKTLARETARDNIRVNCVCPGPTETPLLDGFTGEGEFGKKIYEGLKRAIPLKRLGLPEDVAGIVVFLASDEAEFITGQTISVSGGLTMHG